MRRKKSIRKQKSIRRQTQIRRQVGSRKSMEVGKVWLKKTAPIRMVEIDGSKLPGQNILFQIDRSKYTGPKRWVQEIGSNLQV